MTKPYVELEDDRYKTYPKHDPGMKFHIRFDGCPKCGCNEYVYEPVSEYPGGKPSSTMDYYWISENRTCNRCGCKWYIQYRSDDESRNEISAERVRTCLWDIDPPKIICKACKNGLVDNWLMSLSLKRLIFGGYDKIPCPTCKGKGWFYLGGKAND